MRQGSNPKRPRGRNGRKSTNPRSQSFESNGPEVRVRGNAQQVVEKYLALAQDAATAGDRIRSESYFQHAEHYQRIQTANGGERGDGYAAMSVATFEELLQSCVQFEVTFMVCEMGLRAEGLEGHPLRDDIPLQEGGVVTFLNDTSKDGAVIFI